MPRVIALVDFVESRLLKSISEPGATHRHSGGSERELRREFYVKKLFSERTDSFEFGPRTVVRVLKKVAGDRVEETGDDRVQPAFGGRERLATGPAGLLIHTAIPLDPRPEKRFEEPTFR